MATQKSDKACVRCGKVFDHPYRLRDHLARKTPCDPIIPPEQRVHQEGTKECAYCGRRFTTSAAKCRHQKKSCRAALHTREEVTDLRRRVEELETTASQPAQAACQPPQAACQTQNIQNNTTVFAPVTITTNVVAPVTTNIVAIGAGAQKPPGWPVGWAIPAAPPQPFPTCLTIPLEVLRRAVPTDARDVEACRRGEPGALAALMVGIVRHLHTDPRGRNMYLNPKRADQVLVYIPERWEVRPLLEAVGLVFDQVAEELEEALPLAEAPLKGVAQAAHDGFHAKRGEVVRCSRDAMAAHLENMARLARSGDEGESWLGLAAGPAKKLRGFAKESHSHLTPATLADNLERSLGVFSEADLAKEPPRVQARRALVTYARLLLAGRPDNLTVAALEGETVYVWEGLQWKAEAAKEKAHQQAERMLEMLLLWLGKCREGEAQHLAVLAGHIETYREELAAEEGARRELLTQYAKAAQRHHGEAWALARVEEAEARKARVLMARPQLLAPPQCQRPDLDALLESLLE